MGFTVEGWTTLYRPRRPSYEFELHPPGSLKGFSVAEGQDKPVVRRNSDSRVWTEGRA